MMEEEIKRYNILNEKPEGIDKITDDCTFHFRNRTPHLGAVIGGVFWSLIMGGAVHMAYANSKAGVGTCGGGRSGRPEHLCTQNEENILFICFIVMVLIGVFVSAIGIIASLATREFILKHGVLTIKFKRPILSEKVYQFNMDNHLSVEVHSDPNYEHIKSLLITTTQPIENCNKMNLSGMKQEEVLWLERLIKSYLN